MASPVRERDVQSSLIRQHTMHEANEEAMDTSPPATTAAGAGHVHHLVSSAPSPPPRSSPTTSSHQPPSSSTSISYASSSNYASDVSLSPDHADLTLHHHHHLRGGGHPDDDHHAHNDHSSPRRSSVTSHTSSNATTGDSKGSSALTGEGGAGGDEDGSSAGVVKDEAYWERRKRNNDAAKRSREKRRLNDMAMEQRLMELAEENKLLKSRLAASTTGLHLDASSANPVTQLLLPTVAGLSRPASSSHSSSVIVTAPPQPPVMTAVVRSPSEINLADLNEPSRHKLGDQASKHRRQHPPPPPPPSIQSASGSAFSIPTSVTVATDPHAPQQQHSSPAMKVPQFLYAPPVTPAAGNGRIAPMSALFSAAGSVINSGSSQPADFHHCALPPFGGGTGGTPLALPFAQITAPSQLAGPVLGPSPGSNAINPTALGQFLQLQSVLAARTTATTGSSGPPSGQYHRSSPIVFGQYPQQQQPQHGPWPLNALSLPHLAGTTSGTTVQQRQHELEQPKLERIAHHGAVPTTPDQPQAANKVILAHLHSSRRIPSPHLQSSESVCGSDRVAKKKSGKDRRGKGVARSVDGDKKMFRLACSSSSSVTMAMANSGSLNQCEDEVAPRNSSTVSDPFPSLSLSGNKGSTSSTATPTSITESTNPPSQQPVQSPSLSMGQIQLMAMAAQGQNDGDREARGASTSSLLPYDHPPHPGPFTIALPTTRGQQNGESHPSESEAPKKAQQHSVTFSFASSSSSPAVNRETQSTASAGTSSRIDRPGGPSSSASSILGSLLVTKRRSPSVPESRTESMSGLMGGSSRQQCHHRARTPTLVVAANDHEPAALTYQGGMASNGYHHATTHHRHPPSNNDKVVGHQTSSSSGSHSPGSPHSTNSTDVSGYSGALPSSVPSTTAATTTNSMSSSTSHGATNGSSRENIDEEEGSSLAKQQRRVNGEEEAIVRNGGSHPRSSTSPSTYNSGDDQPGAMHLHHSRGRSQGVCREVGVEINGHSGEMDDSQMREENGGDGVEEMEDGRHDLVRYMDRRRRNNEAAKRCRANRRAMFEYRSRRAQQLEMENCELRQEMLKLSNELEQLKAIIAATSTNKPPQLAQAAEPRHPPTASI